MNLGVHVATLIGLCLVLAYVAARPGLDLLARKSLGPGGRLIWLGAFTWLALGASVFSGLLTSDRAAATLLWAGAGLLLAGIEARKRSQRPPLLLISAPLVRQKAAGRARRDGELEARVFNVPGRDLYTLPGMLNAG